MHVCMYLFIYKEREIEGDLWFWRHLPLTWCLLSFEIQFSLQRAMLMTLIWNLSPSIVLAKVQSYLWRLLALLSDPNSHDNSNSNPNPSLPCFEKNILRPLFWEQTLLAHGTGREIQQILLSQVRSFSNCHYDVSRLFSFFSIYGQQTWGFPRKIHSHP